MSTIIGLFYSIFIIVFAGRSVFSLKILELKDEPYGIMLPLYFLAGSIVLSLYMLLLFFLRVPFSVLTISSPFLLYMVFYAHANYRSFIGKLNMSLNYFLGLARAGFDGKSILRTLFFFLIFLVISMIFLQNSIIPIFIGDSYAHWFFKAKAIFVSGTIPGDILTNMNFFYTRTDYPLLVPLNLAWIAMCTGGWSDTITRSFFSFCFLSMIVFLYFSLKKYIDENLALYGAFIASVVPCFVRESVNGYVDIIVAILTMVSAILLFNWFTRTRKTGYLLLSAIFIGGAAWTKNDGIALFAAMSLALLAYLLSNLNKKELGLATASSRLFAFIAAGGIVFLPFRIFVGALGIRNHMISGSDQILSFTSNLWRVPYIFNQFLYEFFLNTSIWLYFWIFFFLMIFVGRKRIFNSDAKYILLFMLLYSAFLFYVYMVTALGSSVEGLKGNLEELERLLLHIAPTAVFVIMLSFNKERSL